MESSRSAGDECQQRVGKYCSPVTSRPAEAGAHAARATVHVHSGLRVRRQRGSPLKGRNTEWTGVQQPNGTFLWLIILATPAQPRHQSPRLALRAAARGGGRRAGPGPRQLRSKMDAMCQPRRPLAPASLLLPAPLLAGPAAPRHPRARTAAGGGWLRAAGAQLKEPAPAAARSCHRRRAARGGAPGRCSHWASRAPTAGQVPACIGRPAPQARCILALGRRPLRRLRPGPSEAEADRELECSRPRTLHGARPPLRDVEVGTSAAEPIGPSPVAPSTACGALARAGTPGLPPAVPRLCREQGGEGEAGPP